MTRDLCAALAGVLLAVGVSGCGGGGGGSGGGGGPPPQPTASLTANATTVVVNGAVTLTWSSANAASCSASGGWSGAKSTSGSEQVGPLSANATFSLNCSGATANVTVNVVPQPSVTLRASPDAVANGATTTLAWSSTNATTCAASGGWSGSRATSGSQEVGPLTAATTYTLACGVGSVRDSESVTVGMAVISGQLLISSATQTDSDTNNEDVDPSSNSNFDAAQALPNPVVLGGFAATANSAPDGPLRASGDLHDVYRVSLTANQAVELAVGTPADGDLDLGVYNASRTLVNASVGTGYFERVTVPAAGDYFVQVFAYSGASNYVLTIGQAATSALGNGLTLSDDFAPGEILAKFGGEAAESAGAQAVFAKTQLARTHGMTLSAGAPGVYSLLKLNQDRAATHAKLQAGLEADVRFASELDERKLDTLYAIKELTHDQNVAWAQPNYNQQRNAVPNDPLYARQRWHYELMQLPNAWNITTGNANVIAAVIDSGVQPHPEFTGRLVFGYDFITDVINAGDGDGRDADYRDPGEPPRQPGGPYGFHGTHVAGTVAATGNNGADVSGVAWNARIMPLRVCGIFNCPTLDTHNAMLYAARLPNASGFIPTQRADVINLSLGSLSPCSPAYQDVVNQVRAAGVVVVAAAGNESRQGLQPAGSPANCNGVIGVAALGAQSQRAAYSNAGPGTDVAAPGGDGADLIFSTYVLRDGATYYATTDALGGTSMAAPHVTGAIALMKSVNPALTPAQIDALLTSGALTDDIGPAGPDELGMGRLNAFKAVTAAQVGTPPARAGQLSVNPSAVNFGDAATSAAVAVTNAGTQPVSVTQVVPSAPWISAAPAQVNASGLGAYAITVNRTGLSTGVYSGSVEFRGSVGVAARTNVLMQVTSTPIVPNAGQHYILLIDPTTFETVGQVTLTARGTIVRYGFAEAASGSYLLAAGTDLDNDLFICDEGEACGEFPLMGEALPVSVRPSAAGVDFPSGYQITVRSASAMQEQAPLAAGFRRLR